MEGSAAERSVTAPAGIRAAGCVYSVATRAHESELRELLRTNSLGGWIRLAFHREPDAFAATFGLAHSHDFIIAHELSTGRAVGLCERFVRDAYVNGEIVRLPYLGSLRVNADFRNRIRILRNGFIAVRDLLEDPRDASFALTSITADNDIARRVLCAGISGFPQYLPVGEISTFAILTKRAHRGSDVVVAERAELPEIAAFLQAVYRRYQFAPVWRTEDLQRLEATWLVIRRHGRIVASVALWDQGAVKQTVVSGYARSIEATRPLFNLIAPFLRAPRLPPPGVALRQVYLSHIAVTDDSADDFEQLVRAGLSIARERGFDIGVLGLAASNPLLTVVRRKWNAREYRSLLHVVQWSGRGDYRPDDAGRVAHPEIALM